MTREELIPFYEKKVKVVCTDKVEVVGLFCIFTYAEDNEPEREEITIETEDKTLIGIYTDEIKSIELKQ
jgi:hypothetical protein